MDTLVTIPKDPSLPTQNTAEICKLLHHSKLTNNFEIETPTEVLGTYL